MKSAVCIPKNQILDNSTEMQNQFYYQDVEASNVIESDIGGHN